MKFTGFNIKKVLMYAMALAIAFVSCVGGLWTASAESTGSLRLTLSEQIVNNLPAGTVIKYNVYRIGQPGGDSWELFSAYEACGILEAGTSSEKAAAAQSAAQIAEQSDTPTTVTLQNGQCYMTDMPYGIYLVVLKEAPEGFVCTPAILTIPYRTQSGEMRTNAVISFKVSYVQPTETPSPTPSPTPGVTVSPTPEVTPVAPPNTPVVTPETTPEITPPRVTPSPTPSATPTAVPTTNVTVTKTWVDNQNAHGIRPSTVTVALYADGQYVNAAAMSGSASENSWTYTFEGVPAVNSNGNPVEFTVRETAVQGYASAVNGLNVVNTLVERNPEQYGTIFGQKTWVGDNASMRPASITVRLYRDGEEVQFLNVTQDTNWQYSFENMPLDDGWGNSYTYTVREDAVSGYVTRVNGCNITNISMSPPVADPTDTPPTPPMPTTPPEPPTITLTVIVETSDGDELPDVQVTVASNEGGDTVSDATDDDGTVEFEVEPGEYTVTAETPVGYLSNDPEIITVTDDYTLTIVYSRGSELPSTGSVWLIPMYGVGVAIILLSVFYRKKKVRQE